MADAGAPTAPSTSALPARRTEGGPGAPSRCCETANFAQLKTNVLCTPPKSLPRCFYMLFDLRGCPSKCRGANVGERRMSETAAFARARGTRGALRTCPSPPLPPPLCHAHTLTSRQGRGVRAEGGVGGVMTNAEAHARASRRARPRAGSAAPNGRSPMWGNAWYGDETARGAGVPQRQRGASPAVDGVKRSIFEPGEIPGLEGDTGGGADDDTHHDEQERAGEYELRAHYRPPSQPRPPPSPQQHQRADYNDIYQQEWPNQQNGYQQYEAPSQQAKPKMRFDDWLAEAEGTPAQGNAARRRQQAAARRSGRLPQLVGARGAGSPSVAGSVASRMSLGVPRLQHNRPKGMRGPSPPPKPGSVVGSVDMYGSPQADPRWRPAVQRADREGRERNRAGSLGLGMLPEKGTELSHTPSKGRRHSPLASRSPMGSYASERATSAPSEAPSGHGSPWSPYSAPRAFVDRTPSPQARCVRARPQCPHGARTRESRHGADTRARAQALFAPWPRV